MKYISYAYYKDDYLGTFISSPEEFSNVSLRAEAYIDKITYGNISVVNEDVKNAVCAVCDVISRFDKQIGIKSESVDGYSVTLDNSQSSKALFDAASLFLPPYLLYRGV